MGPFEQRIRRAQKALGIRSLLAFAKAAKVSHSTLSNRVNAEQKKGATEITPATARKLVALAGESVEYWMSREPLYETDGASSLRVAEPTRVYETRSRFTAEEIRDAVELLTADGFAEAEAAATVHGLAFHEPIPRTPAALYQQALRALCQAHGVQPPGVRALPSAVDSAPLDRQKGRRTKKR